MYIAFRNFKFVIKKVKTNAVYDEKRFCYKDVFVKFFNVCDKALKMLINPSYHKANAWKKIWNWS